jgi:hypothetical protein
MLYGMDNNISTVKTPLSVPEIEVDDSITLTGTGLSPFLKIHKKSAETADNLTEKSDNEIVTNLIDKKINKDEHLIAKNDIEIIKTCINKKSDNSHKIIEKNDKELLTNIRYV